MSSRVDSAARHPATLVLVWAGCVAVVALFIDRSWISLDDGTLAQSAERVLHGQLPHRDFVDPYSGLGAMLGAAAFHLFGVTLLSLRLPLVAAFALWLPVVWAIARRFASPGATLLSSLLAAALSVLTYPAAMPTWYGLFLATWSAWFVLRFLDDGHRRWLLAAGVAAGVSVLFKVVGLYTVAAALLTVAWRRADGSRAHRALVGVGCALFVTALGFMVLPGTGPAGAYGFLLPSLALCASLLRHAWHGATEHVEGPEAGPDRGGAPALLRDATVLLAGVTLPILVYLVPYVAAGGVGAWLNGVFVLPFRRLSGAFSPPGRIGTVVPGVVAVALVAIGSRLDIDLRRRVAMALATLLAMALSVDTAAGGAVFSALWHSARSWIPALVVWGAWRVRDVHRWSVLAAAGLWTLVQFPYTAPGYFFYVAPLGVLATLATAVHRPPPPSAPAPPRRRAAPGFGVGPVLGLCAGVYAFLGTGYAAGVATSATQPLPMERGGLRVAPADALVYGDLVAAVREHADGGGLWAGPDAPEVYFLSGIPNPTPTLYEFLSPGADASPLVPELEWEKDVRVVVVNTHPLFSEPLGAALLSRLEAAFPASREIGPFVVRWREP